MEQWLVKKKLNEAYKITQLRGDQQRQQTIEAQAKNFDLNATKSFKQWMRQERFQEEMDNMEIARLHQMQM